MDGPSAAQKVTEIYVRSRGCRKVDECWRKVSWMHGKLMEVNWRAVAPQKVDERSRDRTEIWSNFWECPTAALRVTWWSCCYTESCLKLLEGPPEARKVDGWSSDAWMLKEVDESSCRRTESWWMVPPIQGKLMKGSTTRLTVDWSWQKVPQINGKLTECPADIQNVDGN